MSVVKTDQFEALLKDPTRRAALFLLHGSDSDLASERARRLAPKLADDVVRLSGETLANDPGRLADEALAVSMFGDRRVIWIEAGGRDISALIEAVADALPAQTALLVEADSLKKGSALRVLFETRANAVSIECYPAAPANLAQMVEEEARLAGVKIERQARDHLVALLAADPAAARGELVKLMLYAQSTGALDSADIDAAASGGGASPVDALIDAALAGDLAALERGVALGLADSGDAAQAAMRLAQRIALLIEIRQGGAEPERMHRLPYSVKKAVLAQANALAPEALARRLPALLNLLITTRRDPALGRASAFRALSAFALAARRGG
ncbi:MAG: hypothetical protein KGM15_14060 [Pseudomonadota bacterium]|nr:hypothetical protein [Pseudomonadota bacterium]